MREVTKSDIDNPERLLYLFRDLTNRLNEIQNTQEQNQFNSAEDMRKLKAAIPPPTPITGTSSPAEALVRLGVDQTATAKSNLTATEVPGAMDDINAGYNTTSIWIVPGVTPAWYVCIDPSPGNAVWKKVTLT